MRTVILASHGHLASGMKNTVEMILGEQEALKAFDAYTTPECNVHDTLEAMLRQADGECVIVTDVLGGSVNKEAVVFAAQPGVRVITGMNLTLVATLLTEEELETCFRCFAVFGENMDRLSGSRKTTKGDAK